TVRHQNLHSAGQLRYVSRQRIADLDHRAQVLRPLLQHIGDVLARMLAASEVQSNLLALPGRNDAAGEHAGAFVTGSRSNWSTFMLVSSLCITSPCAACRISSSRAGLTNSAASS